MKRFVFPVILVVALIVAAGFVARTALAITGTSSITVTVPEYIAIEGLGPITISNVAFSGAPATGIGSGTDAFTVEANVVTAISAAATAQPSGTTWTGTLAGSTNPGAGAAGSTPVVLTASVSGIAITTVAGNYTGGVITVTVTK